MDEEWINASADELAGRAYMPTPSPSISPTASQQQHHHLIHTMQLAPSAT